MVRLLVKSGAEVKVVCTPEALNFVTPLTLATLSRNPVHAHFSVLETGEWVNHVELGKWADYFIVAPATANTMAKMANGYCDNLLLATYMSSDCPVFFAPAMDLDMYLHPTTEKNIEELIAYGHIELPAEEGELASGLEGKGRMCEPETILRIVEGHHQYAASLSGKTVLVNAGPTYEKLDPVRFIGNYSSGKMGIAIANNLVRRGAQVELVLGPSKAIGILPHVRVTRVESAQQMYDACTSIFEHADAAVLSAAVADYRPNEQAPQKIKKKDSDLTLSLTKTPDILRSLGEMKRDDQILVGFALETENEYENAMTKLKKKNLDFIVLNSLNDTGAGFGVDTNKVTVIEKSGKSHTFGTKPKIEVAADIVEILKTYL